MPVTHGVAGSSPVRTAKRGVGKGFPFFVMAYYTYILYSKSLEKFYKGSTQDVFERLKRHNGGREKATKYGVPWILLWTAEKPNRSEAQKLEYKLKNLSRKRLCRFMIHRIFLSLLPKEPA